MAIITISRQVGSLGEEIARQLSSDLGYKMVSRDDFMNLADHYDSDVAVKLKKISKEEGPGVLERLFFSTPIYLSLFEALIFEMASQRQIIIMGRGAQIVLRDVHQVYRIRVVAPTHLRVLHMRQVHGMSTDEALEFVRKHDRRRRNVVRQVFDHDLRDWGLYDMVLNTASLDVEGGVEIIKRSIDEIKRLQPMEEASQVLQGLALGKRLEASIRQEVLPSQEVEVLGEFDGTVTLMGSLTSKDDRDRAEEIAGKFPGVTNVINKIKTSFFTFGY